MKRKSLRKRNKKMTLLLVILGLSVGYALISTTLNITGIAGIRHNTWDIRWNKNKVQLNEDLPSGTPLPRVTGEKDTVVEFETTLELPGDYYEFYVDAINTGTIDGQISQIKTTWKKNNETISELPSYLTYTLVYADNEQRPAINDVLKSQKSRTYKVRLEYNETATTPPSGDEKYDGVVEITYTQRDENGVEPDDGEDDGGNEPGPGSSQIIDNSKNTPDATPADTKDPVKIIQEEIEDPENPGETALPPGTNTEFMGNDPDNYIYFNCSDLSDQSSSTCEIWRVIGTDTDNGDRIKIIRNASIGKQKWNDQEYEWDDSTESYTATNNWADSTLKAYLNGTYFNGLEGVSQNLVADANWYTEGFYNSVSYNNNETNKFYHGGLSAKRAYVNERTPLKTSIRVLNRSNVNAKVGLMYASDYGYGSAACYSNTCMSTSENVCDNDFNWEADSFDSTKNMYDVMGEGQFTYHNPECRNSNWLYKGIEEWTITAAGGNPWNDGWEMYNALYIVGNSNQYSNGSIAYDDVSDSKEVRPVVYLKKGVDLEGTGSINDPFKIIATQEVLDTPDVVPEPSGSGSSSGGSSGTDGADITHITTDTSCGDTTPPTCELVHVNVLSGRGFEFAFNCTDDTQINRITSLFDHDPFNGDYDSRTFDRIGTIKNGTVLNNGKTKSYSSRWTTASTSPPNNWTCYYFSYGGEDACGNWVVYHTPTCYQY